MSHYAAEVVERKIVLMQGYLADLESVKDLTVQDYQQDTFRRRGIEKTLINIIQAAVDINNYILVKSAKIASADNYDSFVKMGEQGIIPQEFVDKIAPSAGLRSRLVHEYDRVDDAIVHASLADALDQFPRFIEYIVEFLKRSE